MGICRTFDYCDDIKIKSNIVKEVNGNLYKIYSEGDPLLIREKCRGETLPQNFYEMIEQYKNEGYKIIGISGKKMKMNYLQSQKIERCKCESNMTFLGFAIYKVNYDGYKSAYSWWDYILISNIDIVNILRYINNYYKYGLNKTISNYFFYLKFIIFYYFLNKY